MGRANKGGHVSVYGYRVISVDGKAKLEHVAVAEKAMGRSLPKGAQVHHLNGDPLDNRPANLVVCPSANYHRLLHRRGVSMEITGRPDAQQCFTCQHWIVPEETAPFTWCLVKPRGANKGYRLSRRCPLRGL